MFTPNHWKRSTLSSASTRDNTLIRQPPRPPPLHSFLAPAEPPLPTSPPSSSRPAVALQRLSTTEIEREIGEAIERDSELQRPLNSKSIRGHLYLPEHYSGKLAISTTFELPERVKRLYDQPKSIGSDIKNFTQGFLTRSKLHYFCVQRRLFFYDIEHLLLGERMLQQCFVAELELDDFIFELKEIDWDTALIRENLRHQILVFSHAWKLKFVHLQIIEGSTNRERDKRDIRIVGLNMDYWLNTQRAYHLTVRRDRLYFLDDKGQLNYISAQFPSYFFKQIKGSKLQLTHHFTKNRMEMKQFYDYHKKNASQRLIHYFKVVTGEIKSIFLSHKTQNIAFFYDSHRQIMCSLTDVNPSIQSSQPRSSVIIRLYALSDGQMVQRCTLTQAELYYSQLRNNKNSDQYHNYRIASIHAVQSNKNKSNLMVVLYSGTRVYLNLQKICKIQHIAFIPESWTSLGVSPHRKEPRDPSQFLKIVSSYSNGHASILTILSPSSRMKTLFITKGQDQSESVVDVKWTSSLEQNSETLGIPIQERIYRTDPRSFDIGNGRLLKLERYGGKKPVHSMHELARSVYYEPEVYLRSTDIFLEYCFQLRSVDLVVMAFEALGSKTDSNFLKKAINLSKQQLIALLVQVHSDSSGRYIKDEITVQKLRAYQYQIVKKRQQSLNFRIFSFQHEQKFVQISLNQHSLKGRRNPQIVSYHSLNLETRKKHIREIINVLAREIAMQKINNQCKSYSHARGYQNAVEMDYQFDQSIIYSDFDKNIESDARQAIKNAIVLYIGRLLRILWHVPITKISRNAVAIGDKLKGVKQLINCIFSGKDAKDRKKFSREDIRQKNPLQEELLAVLDKIQQLSFLIATVNNLEEITFGEALSSNPSDFQEILFYCLIREYRVPSATLQDFQKAFPLFICKSLQKSVKVYEETKNANPQQILNLLKYHTKIPQYLLNYLSEQKGVYEVRLQAKKMAWRNSITLPSGNDLVSNINWIINKIQNQQSTIDQKLYLLENIEHNLVLYRKNKKQLDSTYNKLFKRKERISKVLRVQQMFLQEFKKIPKTNHFIIDKLSSEYLDTGYQQANLLKESAQTLNIPAVFIVYLTLLDEEDEDGLKYQIGNMVKNIFESKNEDKDLISVIRKGYKKIRGTQCIPVEEDYQKLYHQMEYILVKTRNRLNITLFLESFNKSMFEDGKINEHVISESIAKLNGNISQLTKVQNKLVLIAPILLALGVERAKLIQFYQKQFQRYSFNFVRMELNERWFILYNWLNYFSIIYSGQIGSISLFSRRTKELLQRCKRRSPYFLQEQILQSMDYLVRILHRVQ